MAYAVTPGNINLGACKIWYHDTNGFVALGATVGGTAIKYSPKFLDLKIDQYGDAVVKKILQSESASISFGIAEAGLERLNIAIPFGTIYADGNQKAMGIGAGVGGDLLERTAKLKVHPINNRGAHYSDDESYTDDDFIIWKAGNASVVELSYSSDSAHTYKVTLDIYPDFAQSAGKYLFVIGDPSITGDSTAPSVHTSDPDDGDIDIAVDQSPVIIMSEPIRMIDKTTPNCIANLIKESDHSVVSATISAEQYMEGTATDATSTTLDLASGDVFADDCFNGLSIEIYDGTGAKPGTLIAITDSDYINNRITVSAWSNGTPDTTSKYRIHATRITVDPASSLSGSTDYNLIVANAVDLSGNVQTSIDERDFTTI